MLDSDFDKDYTHVVRVIKRRSKILRVLGTSSTNKNFSFTFNIQLI